MYGLGRMNSNQFQVRALLSVLLPKVKHCRGLLTSQSLNLALLGLKEMDRNCHEVSMLLQALEKKKVGNLNSKI